MLQCYASFLYGYGSANNLRQRGATNLKEVHGPCKRYRATTPMHPYAEMIAKHSGTDARTLWTREQYEAKRVFIQDCYEFSAVLPRCTSHDRQHNVCPLFESDRLIRSLASEPPIKVGLARN